LLSKEAYEKFMQDIQKKINEADKSSKQKAENILKTMTDSYNDSIQERLAYELQMKSEMKAGNFSEAERHKIRAEIYLSVLGVTGNVKL
jgi:SOS-response transcriptional repressor LexA